MKIEAFDLQGKITQYGKSLLNFPMSVLTSHCALKLLDKSEIFQQDALLLLAVLNAEKILNF